jgi:hypothetical protein
MCGRFVQYSNPDVYASQFDLNSIGEASSTMAATSRGVSV